MCSMWYYSEHNGGDDLCSNTAVNEWMNEWESVIHADKDIWRHLVLIKKKTDCWKWKYIKNVLIENNDIQSGESYS